MKRKIIVLCMLGVCLLMSFSCERAQNSFIDEVYLVGVDPCTLSYPSETPQKGYVVQFSKNGNVALTYNLPMGTANEIDEFISINPTVFKDGTFFKDEYKEKFKIKITYRYANQSEMVFPVCQANIDLSEISQIKSQIIINGTI